MDRIENKMSETWIADLTEAQLFQNTKKARRQAARKYSQQKGYKKFTKHYKGDKSRSYKVNSERLERIEEQEELIEDIQPNLQQLDNQQIVENNSQSLEDIINNAANELEINNKKRGYKPKKR
jgi:hypothetical protein